MLVKLCNLPDHCQAQETEDPLKKDVVEAQASGVSDGLLSRVRQDDYIFLLSTLVPVGAELRFQHCLVLRQPLGDKQLLAVKHFGPAQHIPVLIDEGELRATGLDLWCILHLVLKDALEDIKGKLSWN